MITIDQIPDPVRRANAFRLVFANILGFDLERETFLVTCETIANLVTPPLPAGHVYITAVVARSGDPDMVDFCAVGGTIPAQWWTDGPDRLVTAWNGLDQTQRNLECRRWVSAAAVIQMTRILIERGIMPPAALQTINLEQHIN